MKQTPEKTLWFPAKKFGWGWGAPTAWQGWAVLAGWLVLLSIGSTFLAPVSPSLSIAFAIMMSLLLIIICFIKGEKPRWRWGKD